MDNESISKRIGSILLYLIKNFKKKDVKQIKNFIFKNLNKVK